MQNFIDRIVSTLEANGFPSKKVSLPTEKMYEAADNKGLSFNAVLEKMKEDLQIEAQIGAEKTVFTKLQLSDNPFEGMDQDDMMAKAQEMMGKMSPEELKAIQDQILNMSPEQKAEMMKKGKEMGLVQTHYIFKIDYFLETTSKCSVIT